MHMHTARTRTQSTIVIVCIIETTSNDLHIEFRLQTATYARTVKRQFVWLSFCQAQLFGYSPKAKGGFFFIMVVVTAAKAAAIQ